MAKKPEGDEFADMFRKLGEDLKLPDFDIDRILEHHRKNLEALQKSAETAGEGATAMMSRQRRLFEQTLRDIASLAPAYRASSPQELATRQVEFARKSFDAALGHTQEMTELLINSGTRTLDVLRQRIREGMEEIREDFDKRR